MSFLKGENALAPVSWVSTVMASDTFKLFKLLVKSSKKVHKFSQILS